jgi:hypothetical protein
MWWLRVSYCALSLSCALAVASCGSSGFSGTDQGGGSGQDALTLSFQGFDDNNIMQEDTVGNTSATVDVCQSFCNIGGGIVNIELEQFTETYANANFINNGTADIQLQQYTVTIPNTGIPSRTVNSTLLIPGGRCGTQPNRHCGLDTDCPFADVCDHVEVPVQILLYTFQTKELLVGDATCPRLDFTDPNNPILIPGTVVPKTLQTNVSFRGSDETGKTFKINTGIVGSFFDANNCTTTGTASNP